MPESLSAFSSAVGENKSPGEKVSGGLKYVAHDKIPLPIHCVGLCLYALYYASFIAISAWSESRDFLDDV